MDLWSTIKIISAPTFFYVSDLFFNLKNTEMFDVIAKKIHKTNFIVWTRLHYSVPNYLKNNIITAISINNISHFDY